MKRCYPYQRKYPLSCTMEQGSNLKRQRGLTMATNYITQLFLYKNKNLICIMFLLSVASLASIKAD